MAKNISNRALFTANIFFIAAVVILSVATYYRNLSWRNSFIFWSDNAVKSPKKIRPHANLADVFRANGMPDRAIMEYEMLLKEYPTHPVINYEFAKVLQQEGFIDYAIVFYKRAAGLLTEPEDIKAAYNNMGNCYAKKGLFDDALASYERALEFSPGDPMILKNIRIVSGLSIGPRTGK